MSNERIHQSSESLESYIERIPLLKEADRLAEEAHAGQTRANGEPYITHPRAVARIFYEEWGITDPERLAAALLHDTIEDTKITKTYLEQNFGTRIANWVDGVTNFPSDNHEVADAETKKKVLTRSFIDPNVALFKLADRLHNMRTMNSMPETKRIKKSDETLKVYAPLAESLGMWKVKTELENLAFQYTDPGRYKIHYDEMIGDDRTGELFTANRISQIKQILDGLGVKAIVVPRYNSLVRLKDKRERTGLKEISDMISFRVIVDANGATGRWICYGLMGEFRNKFKNEEDISRFSDAFDSVRDNGYSAMHMIFDTFAGAIEVAITTKEKEDFNDWGIVNLIKQGQEDLSGYSLKLIFTPTGKAKILVPEATGVDFAYSRTDDFGNRAESIYINGERMPITTVLPHGASVNVVLGTNTGGPTSGIENYAHGPAKKRIERQRKLQARRELEKIGKERVSKIIEEIGLLDLEDLIELDYMETSLINFLHHLGCKGSLEELYYQMGSEMTEDYLRKELHDREFIKEKLKLSSILLEGDKDVPGILAHYSAKVSKLECNILTCRSRGGSSFILRFLVDILSEEKRGQLLEEFKKDKRITNVKIV